MRPEKRPVRPYSSLAWLSQASSAATAPDASTLPRPPLLLAQLPCTDTHLRRMNVPGCRLPSPHVSLRHDQSDNEIWLPHVPACRPGSLGDAGDLGRAGYRRIGPIHGEINALAARPSRWCGLIRSLGHVSLSTRSNDPHAHTRTHARTNLTESSTSTRRTRTSTHKQSISPRARAHALSKRVHAHSADTRAALQCRTWPRCVC